MEFFNCVAQIAKLKKDIEEEKKYNKELKSTISKMREDNIELTLNFQTILKENADLKTSIEFYRGQVEAYQICWGYRPPIFKHKE